MDSDTLNWACKSFLTRINILKGKRQVLRMFGADAPTGPVPDALAAVDATSSRSIFTEAAKIGLMTRACLTDSEGDGLTDAQLDSKKPTDVFVKLTSGRGKVWFLVNLAFVWAQMVARWDRIQNEPIQGEGKLRFIYTPEPLPLALSVLPEVRELGVNNRRDIVSVLMTLDLLAQEDRLMNLGGLEKAAITTKDMVIPLYNSNKGMRTLVPLFDLKNML